MLAEWKTVAHGLGWPLAFVSEPHLFGWSFASFTRLLREPASSVPKRWPWVHGTVRERPVILRPMRFYRVTTDSLLVRALMPPDGSGLEQHAPPPPLHTMAMAEIDPPIFAGLQLVTKPSARFGHPQPFQLIRIARGDLAKNVWATAHDATRVDQLFSYGAPASLLRPPFSRGQGGFALHDGVVEVFVEGVPNAAVLREMVALAAQLGEELSALSRALPMRLADWPVSQQWAKVAAERGLAFDPQRWRVQGSIEGIDVEAQLETGHGKLATSARAKLRRPLACGVALRKALSTERPTLFTRAPGNVVVGERDFDADFVIDAIDPAGARACFSRNGVSEPLRTLIREGATQVLLDDEHVFVSDDGCSGEVRLAHRIDTLRAVVSALTPLAAASAYR